MTVGDIYNRINKIDSTALDQIINRLEFRDSDALFTQLRDAYLDRLPTEQASRVLDVGRNSGLVIGAHSIGPAVLVERYDFVRRLIREYAIQS